MVTYNEKLYVFGGHGDLQLEDTVLKSMEIYDITAGEESRVWKLGAKMITGVQQAAAVGM